MKGLVVECFGMPGVGKTFFAKALQTKLTEAGLSVDSRFLRPADEPRIKRVLYKLRLVVPFLFIRPGCSWTLLRFVLQVGVTNPRDFSIVLFNWFYVAASIRRGLRAGAVVLLDQGMAQAVWSTVYRGKESTPADVKQLFKRLQVELNLDEIFAVHVQAEEHVVIDRVHKRQHGGSPLDKAKDISTNRASQVNELVNKYIHGLEKSQPWLRIINIDNSQERDISDDVARVIHLVSAPPVP